MTKDELMRIKGELTTQIEIFQAKLNQVNSEIIKILQSEEKKKDP